MDVPSPALSSNVTVEYTDPFGLFPLVQPVIERKLPLKNLHWKSPTRPVRSIESLRIGFVPAAHNDAEDRKVSNDTHAAGGTGAATAAAGRPGTGAGTTAPVPHRRHQIPGLRSTPYLKIYLLRCDDNETYKATARKTIREWIKAQGPTPLSGASGSSSSGSSSSQEKHDAFEWLIVHVVQDGDGSEKAVTTSKWGRSPTTVLEKVKADFNGSSKSSVDRVAQLRLPKPDAKQPPTELAEQLEDLVEKMQTGILASFDQRVAQYEEDIKERDSQRNLPGWNFCTFFILKEGLARGFEDVGLLEDALVGYDELAVGLDTTIREQLENEGERHGATFLACTKDWKDKAMEALESAPLKTTGEGQSIIGEARDGETPPNATLSVDEHDFPLDASKKPYRDMILANNISIFDFRVYVFSRQLALLLRAARAPWLIKKETEAPAKGGANKKPEDLILLAKVCERAGKFLGLATRTLKYDLECGLADVDNPVKDNVISNLVSCWGFSAASQILTQTATSSLILSESSFGAAGRESSVPVTEIRPDVPRRSSSLIASPVNRSTGQTAGSPEGKRAAPHLAPKPGSDQLASARGELISFSRRMLESVAALFGWVESWTGLELLFDAERNGLENGLESVSLDDSAVEGEKAGSAKPTGSLNGLYLPVLASSLKSQSRFRSSYEALTDQMFRHFLSASRQYSAEKAVTDIALLRFRQANYAAAASYFHRLAPFYGNKGWTVLEGAILEMYARCLKELDRTEEYVQILLRLLAKFAVHQQSMLTAREQNLTASTGLIEHSTASTYVKELLRASKTINKDLSANLTDFFADLRINPAIHLYEGKDGFQVQLSLRFLLGQEVELDNIKLRLVSANNSLNNEHWIESTTKVTVKSSLTKILVDSSTTLLGKYFVDRIDARIGNIVFSQTGRKTSSFPLRFTQETEPDEEENRSYIYCFPRPDGLQARVTPSHYVNLDEMRSLEFELESGLNEIRSGVIRVRPATAGLRLRIADATVIDGDMKVHADNDTGVIEFAEFGSGSFVRLRIPYTIDENHAMLSVRVEVGYQTTQGSFTYSSVSSIVSALPISVNVQDIFKDDVLFSKFTISPAMMIPLRVLSCDLPSSGCYDVTASITGPVAFDAFPKQPASLLYKIRQRGNGPMSPGTKRSLKLSVEFTCVDDECFDAVRRRFKTDLEGSRFRRYSSLLTTHLVETFRTQLTTSDLEVMGLVREIGIPPYESVQWDGLLSAVKEPTLEIHDWLKEWHKSNPVVPLPAHPTIRSRRIVIPVDVPEVQVVHTAELQLKSLASHLVHAAVGQTIPAELRIRHTRRWSHAESPERTPEQPLEFSYEIHANPDVWLVGGRRRGNFTAQEGETSTFDLMLLPQRPGHLLLPGVEIKTFVSSPPPVLAGTSSGSHTMGTDPGPTHRRPVPCEVDYRNHAETLLVLPDLCKTTVSLPASGGQAGGGSWLVESERRSRPGPLGST